MKVQQQVPEHLQEQANAALAWFSDHKGAEFKITGIVEEEPGALSVPTNDIQLILCGTLDDQEVCLRETFEVTTDHHVTYLPEEDTLPGSPAPELDPPEGTRKGWLDGVLDDTEFVVLLFYRGLW